MIKPSNRRRFPRLEIADEARVYDANGRELGRVAEVSGSGMNIEVSSPEVAKSLAPGQRIRISIVEPGSRETNVMEVKIHRFDGSRLGMEFFTE
jgi:hypothetical protein